MERKSHRKFSSDFKAKVVLEALRKRSTIEDLARKYLYSGLYPETGTGNQQSLVCLMERSTGILPDAGKILHQ